MISIGEFQDIISELLDELPSEFFRDLSGGVIVSAACVIPDYARGGDLYTMGVYKTFSGVKCKGNFQTEKREKELEISHTKRHRKGGPSWKLLIQNGAKGTR